MGFPAVTATHRAVVYNPEGFDLTANLKYNRAAAVAALGKAAIGFPAVTAIAAVVASAATTNTAIATIAAVAGATVVGTHN
jgi:hypothetical protein